MPTESAEPTGSREGRLIELLAAYYEQMEAGNAPDRAEFLARNPDLAEDLARHFDDEEQLQQLAQPLRPIVGVGDLETLTHAGSPRPEMSDATETQANDSIASPSMVRYFGDYEIRGILGRGGMGVVYEALQVSLDRPVALKLIKSGILADPADLRRFEIEAEAAAALDHPNIVPVYEVGEHDGQRYFSMKRIEGRSLADQIDRFQGEPRKAARVLITAARAVQHAHMRGVLHRDLKPSNLLLDTDGNPHVADFGLAKRLDGRGAIDETHTGAILGTPSFMSPEQAEGRVRGITTAADVYGLGAILYAMLSGRPPFQGESTAETLRKVREDRPEPLARINPRVHRDLAIIAEKCLEKDPKRRYESAAAMADDLERWVKGEPIQARAVGRAERLWLWCRRNPTVASLTAGVAASLLIGIVSSTYFGLNERRERLRAERAEQTMEGYLARGLGRALDAEGGNKGILSAGETESLWELARLGDTNVGLRLLDEVTKDPIALAQLQARSEPALIAAVGLDAERRSRAARLLLDRMNDSKRSPIERGEIAFVALELVDSPGPQASACTQAILDGLETNPPREVRARWFSDRGRNLLRSRMQPVESARVLGDALVQDTHRWTRQSLAEGLSAVAARIEPGEAAQLCGEAARVLGGALARETNATARLFLAEGLSAVAALMDPGEAARVFGVALVRETDGLALSSLAKGLSAVAVRMEPGEASRVLGEASRVLGGALARDTHRWSRQSLAEGLSVVVARIGPGESVRVYRPVVIAFIHRRAARTSGRFADDDELGDLAWSTSLLVPFLEAEEGQALTRNLSAILASQPDINQKAEIEIERGESFLAFRCLLADTGREELARRNEQAALVGLSGPLASAMVWARPFPCRLTPQELVELLKMPTCFGPARRIVLDHLGNHYGQRFESDASFLRFAREQGLALDFKTPPKRPDPRETLREMLRALGDEETP